MPLRFSHLVVSLLLAFCFSISETKGQQVTLKGTVRDTSEDKYLTNSVILAIRQSDSVMLGFTRSDKAGHFVLNNIPSGKTIILVTHPAYADFIDEYDLAADTLPNLDIFMILKSELLQEVIITNNWAIRVRGDTTEYKSDSFHLSAGSTVEDLLKKLPGIQVDRNGKITAQGKAVEKVLVDGEEFFSDDPTIVTQNMLSEAVDKVQVYDKKSDQATFTGIDDGVRSKTIDLKLKENRKQGYFGKAELGTDANAFWNNNIMLNAFKGKRKFAAYGIMSNTGRTGLSFNERSNYGSPTVINYIEGGMSIEGGGRDEFNSENFYGEGLPKGWSGGLHYSNKWNEDKIGLNSGYQYQKLNSEARGLTQSKYILPDTLYYINENGNSFSSRYRNTVNGRLEYNLDSSSSIIVTTSGYVGKSVNVNEYHSESLDESGDFVNTSDRSTSSQADNKNLTTSIQYRRKFRKPRRTLSVFLRQGYNSSISEGLLNAEYSYYNADGSIKRQEQTDQMKLNDNSRSSLTANLAYTEPISKNSSLQLNYGLGNDYSRSGITSLEKPEPNGKYEDIIDSLSNDYSLNILTHTGGLIYSYSREKKIYLGLGGNISQADHSRKDIKGDSSLTYTFVNFYPTAYLAMFLNGGSAISISYYGNTQAPSLDQLQPIRDNTDLLNQRIGNPDLKQSFRHRFSGSYSGFKLLNQRSFFIDVNYNLVQNDFTAINFVDELGRRISKPVNIEGNYSYGAYANYSKKLTKPDLRLQLTAGINKSHNTNFINDLKNVNNTVNINGGPAFNYVKDKKYDFSYSPRVTWTRSTSSLRPDESVQYFTQEHTVSANITLPFKTQFVTDCTFSLRQKTDAFDRDNNVTRWNARLDKKFLKNDALVLRLAAFDILDQNRGFQRNVNSNFISERTYDALRRMVLLSFIYNFTKNNAMQK